MGVWGLYYGLAARNTLTALRGATADWFYMTDRHIVCVPLSSSFIAAFLFLAQKTVTLHYRR